MKEACSSAVMDGDDVVMIAHASPNRLVAVSAQIGLRASGGTSSSLGRVLLAALDDRALDKFLARIKPAKLTPATVTDKTELRKAIVKARSRRLLAGRSGGRDQASVRSRCRCAGSTAGSIAALNIGVHSERGPLDTMRKTFLPKLAAPRTSCSSN